MQFPFSQFPRQIATYVFSILLGAILTAGVYRVLPSQAGVAPKKFSSYQEAPALLAQSTISRIPETAAGSFVTAAVNRVGKAVVRIDTERTVNRNPDPLFDDPFFRRFEHDKDGVCAI